MKIKILKANSGDSILITFKGDDKRNHNILIDGGWKRTYNTILKREIREIVIKKEFIDLVVITHIDKDHILGITRFIQDILASKDHSNPLFAYDPVLNYWFNSLQSIKLYINDPTNKTGYQEGNDLETLLEEMGKWDSNQSIVDTMETYNIGRATITVISPRFAELETLGEKWEDYNESLKTGRRTNDYDNTIEELFQQSQAELKRQGELEEDTSGNNASSIAFLFEYRGNKILFLGDSLPSVIVSSLKKLGFSREHKLRVDYVKLSHHGSKYNTNFKLLDLIECQNFIISTNGSRNFPDKETLARILCYERDLDKPIHFLFNYNKERFSRMFSDTEKKKHNFECFFSTERHGYTIEL